jgi:hypothetical protein
MDHEVKVVGAENKICLAKDLKVGQYGLVIDKHWATNHIVVKIFGGDVISIKDPKLKWDFNCLIEVRLLQPGEVINITIKF